MGRKGGIRMHLDDTTRLSEGFVCPHHGAVSVAPEDRASGTQLCPLCIEEAQQSRPGLEVDVPELEHSPLHFQQLEEQPM